MKNGVNFIELGSLCEKIGSGITPKGGDSVYIANGTALIRSQNVYNAFFSKAGLAFIEEKVAQKMASVTIKEKDVLLNITGDSVARCCLAPTNFLPARVNQHVMILRPKCNLLDPQYLAYYLISPKIQSILLSLAASGGTRKALTKGMIERISIPNISLKEQQKKAQILSAYDDLIENNRRRIQLLEQAACLIYQEWFIKFRFPGHEKVKTIGNLPEGWYVRHISDIAETIGGGTPSTTQPSYWDHADVTWFTPTDLTNNDCLVLINSEKKISEKGLKNSSAKILPSYSFLMTSRASIGYFGLFEGEVCTNQGFISVAPKISNLRMYLLHNLKSRVDEICGLAGGATYKEINKTTFRAIKVVVPSQSILKEFENLLNDNYEQVRILKQQIIALETARDLLLPKLMSGEIIL